MIDLAPNHKHGLAVTSPLLLAGGVIDAGDALPRGLAAANLGAVVIGPVTEHSRAGSATPRLAEFPGGFILETGGQNRGADATLRNLERLWSGFGCPLVVQLADHQPQALAACARRLAHSAHVHGFELLLPRSADKELTRSLVRALVRASELPVWVKLPLETAVLLAPTAVESGAVGLVAAQAPLGAVRRVADDGSAQWVSGNIYSPALFPLVARCVLNVARLGLPAALIAAGGVHSADQVAQALAAGAHAVQIDSLAWVEPGLVRAIGEKVGVGEQALVHQAG